ncbi:MAG: hypothetical protein ACPGVY_13835 [Mycobacterium sp.]
MTTESQGFGLAVATGVTIGLCVSSPWWLPTALLLAFLTFRAWTKLRCQLRLGVAAYIVCDIIDYDAEHELGNWDTITDDARRVLLGVSRFRAGDYSFGKDAGGSDQ